jgi:hypothetical protein
MAVDFGSIPAGLGHIGADAQAAARHFGSHPFPTPDRPLDRHIFIVGMGRREHTEIGVGHCVSFDARRHLVQLC